MSLAAGWEGSDARGSIWTGAANFCRGRRKIVVVGSRRRALPRRSRVVGVVRLAVVRGDNDSHRLPPGAESRSRPVFVLQATRRHGVPDARLVRLPPPGRRAKEFLHIGVPSPSRVASRAPPRLDASPLSPARLFRRRRVGGSRRRRRVASPRRLLPRSRRPRRRLRPSPSGGGARRGGQPRRGGVVDPRVRRRPRHGLRRRGDPPSFARRRRPRKPLVPAPVPVPVPVPVPAPAREPLRVRPRDRSRVARRAGRRRVSRGRPRRRTQIHPRVVDAHGTVAQRRRRAPSIERQTAPRRAVA